jgi:hypothetical protein
VNKYAHAQGHICQMSLVIHLSVAKITLSIGVQISIQGMY